MKKKKLLASITAAVCCSGMISYLPEISRKTYASELVYNHFEVNYEGWHGNADAVKLIAENNEGYNGSRGMTVTGRTSVNDGASSSKGFYLNGGVNYDYSIKVYSETDEKFHLSLLCIDEKTGKETITELISKNVEAGVWTELNASYTAPKNSYEFRLTITTDTTNDFCFDNVKITTKDKKSENTVYAASSNLGLKDAFGKYFRVGNILNGNTVRNSTITSSYIKDYNSIECENETKPDSTLVQSQCSGTNIGVSLNAASAIFDFCARNGIGVRGHAFVWHSQTPSWFFKEGFNNNGAWVSESTMDARLESYIKNMFNAIETQYPDLNLYAYDVVNEAVSDDSNRTAYHGGAREAGDNNVTSGTSAWVSVYGDNGFIEKAFTFARKYAPEGCDLYYNDYNEYWDHKRDCIYNICKSLYQKNLLDGVGMQSHISAQYDGFTGVSAYTTAMKKYLSIGCDVQVTELDISVENGTYSAQQQADKYKAVFQAAIDCNTNPSSEGRVTAVCIWGPNDGNSWLKAGSNALLYDSNHNPKLAYSTLMDMINESDWVEGGYEGGEITPPKPNEFNWYFQDGFEGSTNSWQGRGAATIETSGRTAYVGSESLLVQDREYAWNGAYKTLSSRTFVPGNEYSFSANVMYYDGPSTDTFYMKLQYVDSEGETKYPTIAEGTAVKGEWVQLANKNFKIPSDATEMQLYIETAETLNNFYIDEVIGAVGGTGIIGAGESQKVILGDINGDESVDVFDVICAKKGIIDGFDGTIKKICADVDKSGVYDVADLVLIHQFVLRRITEFPVAEKEIDTEAMEKLFSSVKVGSSYKKEGENNPLYTQRFGADPGFLVYNDRLYVYTTNDAFEYKNGQIQENTYDVGTINCISSSDLVNWTDHGPIPVAGRNGRTTNGVAKWASCSWAPDACVKKINGKDKFFLYFANSGGGIGVLTADSPEGPWIDPLGHALVTGATPNCSDVIWMFDPAVLVDDDGTGYLYFGGGVPDNNPSNPGTGRCVKLGDDMISLAGTPVKMNTPYLFEDSSILKIGDTYYYSYCTNWNTNGNNIGIKNAEIAYMTSQNPLGPFTFQGVMFKNTGDAGLDNSGNNHHSLVYFKNKYYLLYHTRQIELRMGYNLNYRSPHIDEAVVSNGKINVKGTFEGVSQLETLNPYNKVQAETMSNQSHGIVVNGLGDTTVSVDKGGWTKVSGVNFSNGASRLTVRASSKNGAAIKICTGSPGGNAIGYVEIESGGSMSEITVPVNGINGTEDIYFVFSDQAEFDWWSFE